MAPQNIPSEGLVYPVMKAPSYSCLPHPGSRYAGASQEPGHGDVALSFGSPYRSHSGCSSLG